MAVRLHNGQTPETAMFDLITGRTTHIPHTPAPAPVEEPTGIHPEPPIDSVLSFRLQR
jgi:hypothetical protein